VQVFRSALDRGRNAKHPAKVLTLIMDTNTGPARYGPQRPPPVECRFELI